MIKAEEIRTFLKNKDAICERFEDCLECPLTDGIGRCFIGNLTQYQIDLIMAWEPPVDWSKVQVDTKVIVWDLEDVKYRRYFAKYENGEIYTYLGGRTSWSSESDRLMGWKFGELAEDER